MRERLIVALDVDNLEQAEELVRLLAGEVGMFKIGKQLFTHAGPQAVRLIQASRRRDFSRLEISRYSQHGRQSGHRGNPTGRQDV